MAAGVKVAREDYHQSFCHTVIEHLLIHLSRFPPSWNLSFSNVASLEQGYVSAISLSVLYYRLSMDMPRCTAETGSMSLKWGNNCNYHTGPSEYKTSLHSVECPVYGKCWAVAVITSLLVAPSWYYLEKAKLMNSQCSSLWLCCKLPCGVTVVGAYIWNHGELFSPQRVSCRARLCWSILKRYLHSHVHCSTIHDSQDVEMT